MHCVIIIFCRGGEADCVLQLGETPTGLQTAAVPEGRVAQAIGGPAGSGGGGAGGSGGDDGLQARLDSLRR